ncbi:MAG: YibE/F family protein [Oscillospiraceae bacterium]|nr:YibE/F family protein [Oscillospiraceae bacterium]
MRKRRKNNAYQFVILFVFSVLVIFAGNRIACKNARLFTSQVSTDTVSYLVRVDSILSVTEGKNSYGGVVDATSTSVKFTGTVLMGEKKGDSVVAVQTYDDVVASVGIPVEKGDWIYVHFTGNEEEARAGNYFRVKELAILFVIIVAFLILFARLKGVASVLSLGLTVASVFFVFVPAILSGYNVYLWALLVCAYSIIITPPYIGGFNKKSLASILGSVGGVTLAGLLTLFLNEAMKITGFASDEDMFVIAILEEPIDLRAVTFAAIIIGALGSTLDVSMSISTSVWEMHETTGSTDFRSLLNSGFNIGRDILGTQISTLILAYIGTSLCTVLLIVTYQPSILEMLNLEQVIINLEDMLVGAATIILTIPFTALISALMLSNREKQERRSVSEFRIDGGGTAAEEKVIYKK